MASRYGEIQKPPADPNAFAASLLQNLLQMAGGMAKGAGNAVMQDPKLGPALSPQGAMQTIGGIPGIGFQGGSMQYQQNPGMMLPGPMGMGMALGNQMSPSRQLIAQTAQKATQKAVTKSIEQRVMSGASPEQILQAYGVDDPMMASQMMQGQPGAGMVQTAGRNKNPLSKPADQSYAKTGQNSVPFYSSTPGASPGLSPSVAPQPASSQAAPGGPPQGQQDPYAQEKIYANPGQFLQTLLTIASGGIIPTPGYYQTAQNIQANKMKRGAQIETGQKIDQANRVPATQGEQLQRQTALDVEKMKADAEVKKQRMANQSEYAKQVISQENAISGDYTKEMEPFQKAKNAYDTIKSYVDNPDPGGGYSDLGITYELIKMFDPNAVREGEIANVKNVRSVPEAVLNMYNQAVKGHTLSPEQRKKVLNTATTKYNALQRNYAPIANQYAGKVKAYDGNPDRALVNYFHTKLDDLKKKIPGLSVEVIDAKSKS